MRILYIPSGNPGIYQYFDECILNQLKNSPGIQVDVFSFIKSFPKLKWICDKIKPDIVITLLGDNLSANTLEWIKRQHFQSIVWLTEDPYYSDRSLQVIPYFDFVFSIDRGAVQYYKKLGYQHVYHLPLGTDPNVFSPGNNTRNLNDICLVGYPYPDRVRLIQFILQETPYQIQIIGHNWNKRLLPSRAIKRCHVINGWIPPLKVAQYYTRAKIILNSYRPVHEKSNQNRAGIINRSVNNRTFDILSTGSCQLTQFVDDLPNYFEEGKEIVSFRTDEELIRKLMDYLSNEQKRQQIAVNGRNEVLNHHTFDHRLKRMFNIVTNPE